MGGGGNAGVEGGHWVTVGGITEEESKLLVQQGGMPGEYWLRGGGTAGEVRVRVGGKAGEESWV